MPLHSNGIVPAINPSTPFPPSEDPQLTACELATSTSTSTNISSTRHPQHVPSSMMDVDNNSSPDDRSRSRRGNSVLSMDDLEAAQALEGLRSGMVLIHDARLGNNDLSS